MKANEVIERIYFFILRLLGEWGRTGNYGSGGIPGPVGFNTGRRHSSSKPERSSCVQTYAPGATRTR